MQNVHAGYMTYIALHNWYYNMYIHVQQIQQEQNDIVELVMEQMLKNLENN
jgi:hypothetical protein